MVQFVAQSHRFEHHSVYDQYKTKSHFLGVEAVCRHDCGFSICIDFLNRIPFGESNITQSLNGHARMQSHTVQCYGSMLMSRCVFEMTICQQYCIG